jgi:hypothetical protein
MRRQRLQRAYAIHELLTVDDELSNAIVKEASALEIKELAMNRGMKTLREDGCSRPSKASRRWKRSWPGPPTDEEVGLMADQIRSTQPRSTSSTC